MIVYGFDFIAPMLKMSDGETDRVRCYEERHWKFSKRNREILVWRFYMSS